MFKALGPQSILIILSLLVTTSAHAGKLLTFRKEVISHYCENLMAGTKRPAAQDLAKMSDVELALIYVKFMMPGYFSLSELKGLPLKEDYYRAAGQRQDRINVHVHQIIQSYDSSVPSENVTILPRLFVVTHQEQDQQSATAKYLRHLENVEVPTLVLLSEKNKLTNRALAQRASYFRYSLGGEMTTVDFVARDVTFVGGFAHMCLASSVRDFIVSAEQMGMTEILLRFEPEYIYEGGESSKGPFLKSLMGRRNPVTKDQFFNALNNSVLRLAVLNMNAVPQLESFATSNHWLTGTYYRQSGMKVNIAVRR